MKLAFTCLYPTIWPRRARASQGPGSPDWCAVSRSLPNVWCDMTADGYRCSDLEACCSACDMGVDPSSLVHRDTRVK